MALQAFYGTLQEKRYWDTSKVPFVAGRGVSVRFRPIDPLGDGGGDRRKGPAGPLSRAGTIKRAYNRARDLSCT